MNKMLMGHKTFILFLIFESVVGLQCDIPGECKGELIGFTSEDSSSDCLATCKGTYNNKLKVVSAY